MLENGAKLSQGNRSCGLSPLRGYNVSFSPAQTFLPISPPTWAHRCSQGRCPSPGGKGTQQRPPTLLLPALAPHPVTAHSGGGGLCPSLDLVRNGIICPLGKVAFVSPDRSGNRQRHRASSRRQDLTQNCLQGCIAGHEVVACTLRGQHFSLCTNGRHNA